MMPTTTAWPANHGRAEAAQPTSPRLMAGTMIIGRSNTEDEARVRSELTSYVAAKLGPSSPMALAYCAHCPLDDLWRLALALYDGIARDPFSP
jgi:hypothetical protein